jgi:hypothetical protein
MARIICRTPSTGKTLRITLKDVSDQMTTIAEAPDFSIPDPSERFEDRDPNDASRAIRPGEIFFLTPMAVKNKSLQTESIEVYLLTEDGVDIIIGKLDVPAGDTGFVPLQGRSLIKRNPDAANGDRVRIKASAPAVFDIWCSAEEKLSNEHIGVEE